MVCLTCRLPASLCICTLVPRLHTRTRLVVVVPQGEARKPSNTGQLAARCIDHSTIQIVRKRSGPMQPPVLHPDEVPLVLFPAPHAIPITHYTRSPRSVVLIVPDGSWHQAHALQQCRALRAHACVTLPSLGPSEYRLRAEPQAGGLATLEAIARALRILEGERGDMIAGTMLDVFRTMVERTLWFRGKLDAHDVTGGIPPAALENDPRGAFTRGAPR
jgi:DTW domain-containing protein